MIRPLTLAACLTATTAHAQDTHTWGMGATPEGPCVIRMALCGGPDCYAEITFDNHLIWSGTDSHITQRLEIDGLAVVVEVIQHDLDRPDFFAVYPPPGFVAVPDHVMVGDDATGSILVQLVPLS